MSSAKRPLWRYPLFQFPAIALGLFLFLGAIEYLLRLGCYPFWVLLFLLLAWAALMWVLVMPLDHVLQVFLNLPMSVAGRVSIINAIAWSVLIAVVLTSGLPKLRAQCFASLDWSRWHAAIWDEMFFDQNASVPIGSEASFSFTVTRNRDIQALSISASEPALDRYVRTQAKSLIGTPVLEFVPGTRRNEVLYEGSLTICDTTENPQCGEPASPTSYQDVETFVEFNPFK